MAVGGGEVVRAIVGMDVKVGVEEGIEVNVLFGITAEGENVGRWILLVC